MLGYCVISNLDILGRGTRVAWPRETAIEQRLGTRCEATTLAVERAVQAITTISMGPILPPTNLDVLLLMGRVPGSSAVAASRYEFILIFLCHRQIELAMALEAVLISFRWLEMFVG